MPGCSTSFSNGRRTRSRARRSWSPASAARGGASSSRERVARGAASEQSGHLPVAGSPGHSIVSALTPRPGELVLDKNTSSAFNSTALDLFLRNMGLTTLVFAGLVTEQCVLMTALDAADRGFHCIIAADGCATIDRGSHEAALLMFRRVWGYVLPSREILAWVASKEQRRGALQ